MLEMRAACERCATTLPMDSADARICSYECTFCSPCVDGPLKGRCPNCQGEMQVRSKRVLEPVT
jgi:uncharacterized protein